MTGSRMLRLGDAMSILARSTREPSGNSPSFMRVNRSRFSSTERSRYGRVLAGLGQRAAVLADLVGREVVDVGLAVLDQLEGPLVKLVEVVGGVAQPLPLEAEPADVALDGVDVLLLFFFGVGVVEAQVGLAAELIGKAEVEADGLGVADVQVAVGLGWKARLDRGVAVLLGAHVLGDHVAEKIGGGADVAGLSGLVSVISMNYYPTGRLRSCDPRPTLRSPQVRYSEPSDNPFRLVHMHQIIDKSKLS